MSRPLISSAFASPVTSWKLTCLSDAPPCNNCSWPDSHPHRATYLTLRTLSCVVAGNLIIFFIIADHVLSRPEWKWPILAPTIGASCITIIDVLFILRIDTRTDWWQRMVCDGTVAVGCSVALGFISAVAQEGDRAGNATVQGAIFGCLFCLM